MIYVFAVLAAIAAYLIGSISTSIILSRAIAGRDIREEGSGNAGATNMLRTHGKKMGVFTLLGDLVKGIIAVLLAMLLGYLVQLFTGGNGQSTLSAFEQTYILPSFKFIGGIFVVIGHNYPVFFGFRGGKGVATSLGVALILSWQVTLVVLVAALLIMVITRYVSLGSISAAILYLVLDSAYMIFQHRFFWPEFIFGVLLAGLMILRHRANIKRLQNGTESKLGEKKKEARQG